MSALARLAAAGSAPLGAPLRADDRDIPEILRPLARVKNGFYAFESALHVYPWGETGEGGASLRDRELWRREYGDEVAGLTFFAEDAFGFQFATDGEAILFFDPETAEREHMAADVEEWAAAVLDDVATHTGFPVMHEWQARNGTIPPGHRLPPPRHSVRSRRRIRRAGNAHGRVDTPDALPCRPLSPDQGPSGRRTHSSQGRMVNRPRRRPGRVEPGRGFDTDENKVASFQPITPPIAGAKRKR